VQRLRETLHAVEVEAAEMRGVLKSRAIEDTVCWFAGYKDFVCNGSVFSPTRYIPERFIGLFCRIERIIFSLKKVLMLITLAVLALVSLFVLISGSCTADKPNACQGLDP
jgi:hypothetical protein